MKTTRQLCSALEGSRPRIAALAILATLALAMHTHTPTAKASNVEYDFTYSDSFGVAAHGWFIADPSSPVDGAGGLLATAGQVIVTSSFSDNLGDNPGVANGTYNFQPYPGTPGTDQTIGADDVDQLIYPGNNAGSGIDNGGITSPAYIDGNGVVFGFGSIGAGNGTGNEIQLGIFSLGGGNYALGWDPDTNHTDFNSPSIDRPNFPGTGVFTLAVVSAPEPSSLVLLGLAGAAVVGYGLRRRRA